MGKLKKQLPTILLLLLFVGLFYYTNSRKKKASQNAYKGIDISTAHKQYWKLNGKTKLLLGGSVEDNLFQVNSVEDHLKTLKEAGGNYVRCTMSSRDSGNVWAFKMLEDGKYDLNEWNPAYWERFGSFLRIAAENNIVVQLEVWATFDFYRENWLVNPFNPKNNINYNMRRAKIDTLVDSHPVLAENNFFRSLPSKMALAPVMHYQQKFVDKILAFTFKYDNILYCIDNETSVSAEWGRFWADYITKKGVLEGKKVFVTEMWDPHDLSHPFHYETFDNPDLYGYVDISQNNHKHGDEHWNNGLEVIFRLKQLNAERPVNNVKIYGNDGGRHGNTQNSVESFIQNVLMGCASARFHRPNSGQGLNETAQSVIKVTRELANKMDFFNAKPHNDLFEEREDGEAYCRAKKGQEYAVYFPAGGEVKINMAAARGKYTMQWVNVLKNDWKPAENFVYSEKTLIKAPTQENWIVLVKKGKVSTK